MMTEGRRQWGGRGGDTEGTEKEEKGMWRCKDTGGGGGGRGGGGGGGGERVVSCRVNGKDAECEITLLLSEDNQPLLHHHILACAETQS